MLVSAQNSVVSQNKSEVWGQFSVRPQPHTVWKCLRTHLAPLWGFLQWLSLVFSLGVRRAGASPSRSPLQLSPTLKMYCSRRAWNMLARQTGLWPCKSGCQPMTQQTMPPQLSSEQRSLVERMETGSSLFWVWCLTQFQREPGRGSAPALEWSLPSRQASEEQSGHVSTSLCPACLSYFWELWCSIIQGEHASAYLTAYLMCQQTDCRLFRFN